MILGLCEWQVTRMRQWSVVLPNYWSANWNHQQFVPAYLCGLNRNMGHSSGISKNYYIWKLQCLQHFHSHLLTLIVPVASGGEAMAYMMDSVLGLWSGVPSWIPMSGENLSFATPHISFGLLGNAEIFARPTFAYLRHWSRHKWRRQYYRSHMKNSVSVNATTVFSKHPIWW